VTSVDQRMFRVEGQLVDGRGSGQVSTSLEAVMDRYHVPGVGLAVIDRGHLVYCRGYGVRGARSTGPITAGTRFQACSISKPITCLGLLRLAGEGGVQLDQDVNKALTSWQIPRNGDWQPVVTPRQIASHCAGLTVSGFPGYRRGETLPTLHQVLSGVSPANTEGVRVDNVPGIQFAYSGGGTTILQQLLEDTQGRPFEELMQTLVLDPAGMNSSAFAQPLPSALADAVAIGHYSDYSAVEGDWHAYPELAAAGLWTTPADLAMFLISLQRSLRSSGELLPPAIAREMVSPHISVGGWTGGLRSAGLGLFVGGSPGARYFGHGGSNEGYRCYALGCDAGCGVVVMTNSDSGMRVIGPLIRAIAREFSWPGFDDSALPVATMPQPLDLPPTSTYRNAETGLEAQIAPTSDGVSVCFDSQAPIVFVAASRTEFVSSRIGSRLIAEPADSSGGAARFVLVHGETSSQFERVEYG
jgi:CubicO group peptidase (beta-lactamase class C family)